MDIREFLEARLAEDELWALACSSPQPWRGGHPPIPTGVHWTWAAGENWEPFEVDPLVEYAGEAAGDTSPTLITVEEWPYDKPMGRWTHFHHRITVAEEIRSAEASHIVRHDPARVLRDVAAKRQILAVYAWALDHADEHENEVTGYWYHKGGRSTLLDTLHVLASAWSEHPDFDPSWRSS